MTTLARRLARARYLVRRIAETPPSFLARKASIELAKKVERASAERGARDGRRFSEGYERSAPEALRTARAVRAGVLERLGALAKPRDVLLPRLAADFDAGTWTCLGYGRLELVQGLWQVDDVHGHAWPRTYFAGLDYVLHDVRCDVKIPWERSRLQWLVRAALAVGLDEDAAGREARLGRARELLADWIAENPYGIGVAWASAMEVALRAVNLVLALALLAEHIDPAERRDVLCCLGEHARYLRRFPETSDVPGNHFLATELGIYVLATLRGGSPGAAERFLRAAEGQFTAEGLHVEHSPTYHRLCLDMLLVGLAWMRRTEPEGAGPLERLAHRALDACETLAGTGGELPVIGDHDGGTVLDLGQSPRRFAYAAPFLGGTPPSEVASLEERALAALLAGIAGAAPARTAAAEGATRPDEARSSAALLPPFAVLAGPRLRVVVKAGTLGLAGRASHDHDDQLSFWCTFDGRDAIVEGGSPPYTRDANERERGIVSTAHNVPAAAGRARFRPALGSVCATLAGAPIALVDELVPGPRPSVRARLVPPTGGGRATGCPDEHVRTIALEADDTLTIEDLVGFPRPEDLETRLHFPPGAEVSFDGARARVALGHGLALEVEVDGPSGLTLREEPYVHHPNYGASLEASRLVVACPAAGATRLVTRVRFRAEEAPCR